MAADVEAEGLACALMRAAVQAAAPGGLECVQAAAAGAMRGALEAQVAAGALPRLPAMPGREDLGLPRPNGAIDNVKAKIQDDIEATAPYNIKAKIQDKAMIQDYVQEVLMAVVKGDNVKAQIQDNVNEVLLAVVGGDNVKAKIQDRVQEVLMADNVKAQIQDQVNEVLLAVAGGDNIKAKIQDHVQEGLMAVLTGGQRQGTDPGHGQ